MILYADILFVINFSMDFLALFFTSIILHIKFKKIHILISSLIGALYGVVQVFITLHPLLKIIVSIIVALIMVSISYFNYIKKQLLAATIVYYFSNMILGGVMTVLYTFFNGVLAKFLKDYTYEDSYNGARTFIIITLTAIASLVFSRILGKKKNIDNVRVIIELDNKKFDINGLCDSGNLLTDPLTGKCVILVSKNSKLGREITSVNEIYKKYIPYKDVNGSGILKGIVPKEVLINDSSVNAIVATVENNDFNGYDALVPSALI